MSTVCPVCNNAIEEAAQVCPYCGFKMLGKTQRFTPITLDENLNPVQSAKPATASLQVVRGPQTGVVFNVHGKPLTIGRSPRCDIFLNDMTVSRAHALLEAQGSNFIIRDQNSYNGVWVNNENVSERILETGDVIQIGVFCLLYKQD